MTELLITLGIIGMVAGISGMWLASQIPKFRLQGATRHVLLDLMATRMRAVSQGNKFRITFLDSRRYTILDDDNNNGKADLGEHLETRDIQSEYRDVTMSSTNNFSHKGHGIEFSNGDHRLFGWCRRADCRISKHQTG